MKRRQQQEGTGPNKGTGRDRNQRVRLTLREQRDKETTKKDRTTKDEEGGGQEGGRGGGRFSFGGTVQYIEESNIYLCFVVCRLKRGLVT